MNFYFVINQLISIFAELNHNIKSMNRLFMKSVSLFFLIGIIVFISSCNTTEEKETGTKTKDTVENDTVIKEDLADVYSLPSPTELYDLMQQGGAKFKSEILNDVNNVKKYSTTKSKAINFGIYASDLAYCSVFNNNQKTFLYFKVAKDLADQLGLTKGFDEKMMNRINKNLNNSDSLFQIATDSYTSAKNAMGNDASSALFPLMIYGGWLEGAYIATRSVDNFKQDNPVLMRVAEQGVMLQMLVEFLQTFEKTADVADVINELIDVQMAFDELMENDEETVMTKAQFEKISKLIFTLRNKYVENK
ncbi:MAG: hypothetical protein A2W91_03130 [Bacteroidetes bacterium GWF2_38_335]|nr:MAG: hypothetical protein A2W91_03130 [Bacteroidetes bacterium GWF2_38_335]OFY77517.1 MAG: hypothetical protein A2281_01630 [Bacteroidetes bacterium RIFOXYA12_FULL_38_20]HBS87187.1 hypothetical protein [Bacteroidales bacterium]